MKTKEEQNARRREIYAQNKERAKEWYKRSYEKNKDKVLARHRKWRESNPDRCKELHANWIANNKEKHLAYFAEYEARKRVLKKEVTPVWANRKAILEFYENCPEGFHVDHIVPLQSKYVSGLHVEFNLQYLPAKDNISKGNRHWPDMPNQEI